MHLGGISRSIVVFLTFGIFLAQMQFTIRYGPNRIYNTLNRRRKLRFIQKSPLNLLISQENF